MLRSFTQYAIVVLNAANFQFQLDASQLFSVYYNFLLSLVV